MSFRDFALFSRSEPEVHDSEQSQIFKDYKENKKENIIPPIGIADPKLVEAFKENMADEDRILAEITELEEYYKESPLETGIRQTLGSGARALEGLGGTIGGMLNMLSGEAYINDAGELVETEVPMLPSTEKLREFTKSKTGKYLEPKGYGRKEIAQQEFAQSVGESLPFLSGIQSLLAAGAGQATKELVKSSGGTEKEADLAKIGMMGIASISNLGNAPNVARQAYQNQANMIRQGVRFSAQPTQQAFARIRNMPWFRTGATPSKNPAMREMRRIEQAIQGGTIDAHEAMQLRRDINEARKELGGFKINQPVDKRQARRFLDEVDQALLESMENYGTNIRPDWWHEYGLANQAYAVTQRSRAVSDFITNYAKPLQSQTAKTIFHVAGGAALVKLPAVAAAAIPIAAGAKGVQILNRMIRSPILRNHYARVLAQANAGNIAAMNRELEIFDKVAGKLENESKTQKAQK